MQVYFHCVKITSQGEQMLYYKDIRINKVFKLNVSQEEWKELGNMIMFLFFPKNDLYYLEPLFYIYNNID